MNNKYRPSNSTDGEAFMSEFCYQCHKMPHSPEADNQCAILGATFFYGTDEPEYPIQWQQDGKSSWCTAFKSRKEFNQRRREKRKPTKDNDTGDMFAKQPLNSGDMLSSNIGCIKMRT